MPTLLTTAIAMHGGVTGVAGVRATAEVAVINTWTTGDTANISLPSLSSAVTEVVGNGEVSGKQPVFALTFKQKIYALYNSTTAFSVVDNPIKFNDLNELSNGTLKIANSLGTTEALTAAAVYQSQLALFSPNLVQTWTVNADANLYEQGQIFENIGTDSPHSVKALGTLDVLFLANTGIRSLRAREYSLDADTVDIGTPIDSLILENIVGYATGACGVVEPNSKRYWVFLKDTIYVLSYFRGSKITAWSSYTPSFSNEYLAGHSFDINGNYAITGLIDGNEYIWVKDVTSINLTNGTNVLTASGTFTADGTTATITGGASDPVLGSLTGQKRFTPTVFDTFNNLVYVRSSDNIVYVFGGTLGLTYDTVQAILESPWLDDGMPMQLKTSQSVDAGFAGNWKISLGANPATGDVFQVLQEGSTTSPDANVDSSFDLLKFGIELTGTHFKLTAASSSASSELARLSEYHLLYMQRETM